MNFERLKSTPKTDQMHLTRRSFSSLSALVFLMGCERELPPPRVPLREADEQTSLGPGDIFQLEIELIQLLFYDCLPKRFLNFLLIVSMNLIVFLST